VDPRARAWEDLPRREDAQGEGLEQLRHRIDLQGGSKERETKQSNLSFTRAARIEGLFRIFRRRVNFVVENVIYSCVFIIFSRTPQRIIVLGFSNPDEMKIANYSAAYNNVNDYSFFYFILEIITNCHFA